MLTLRDRFGCDTHEARDLSLVKIHFGLTKTALPDMRALLQALKGAPAAAAHAAPEAVQQAPSAFSQKAKSLGKLLGVGAAGAGAGALYAGKETAKPLAKLLAKLMGTYTAADVGGSTVLKALGQRGIPLTEEFLQIPRKIRPGVLEGPFEAASDYLANLASPAGG